jgi:hypothetical protein
LISCDTFDIFRNSLFHNEIASWNGALSARGSSVSGGLHALFVSSFRRSATDASKSARAA